MMYGQKRTRQKVQFLTRCLKVNKFSIFLKIITGEKFESAGQSVHITSPRKQGASEMEVTRGKQTFFKML